MHVNQKGFTLIEVLVAILILSFGMLGLVGMQAFALQANREAKLHSEATNLARELAEMMRGNNQISIQTAATDNPYLTTTLALGTSPQTCLKVGHGCSTTKSVAESQIDEWRSRVTNTLPGARIAICFDSQPYDNQGLPQWGCTADATGADAMVVLKIGWTLRDTDTSKNDANSLIHATANQSRPQIIVPISGGNPHAI